MKEYYGVVNTYDDKGKECGNKNSGQQGLIPCRPFILH